MKILIKSLVVLSFVFAVSAPAFAGAQQDKMNSCVNMAISRGYSLDEIAGTLNARAGIDPAVVRARGYDSAEIIAKLGSTCLEKDYALKTFEWYQKAATQGNATAQYNLGFMYATGEGIPIDDSKAIEWYQKAAVQGNADAQTNLGARYMIGDGVPKDAVKGMEWLRKAAAQGNADAQNRLGVMYAFGVGVPKDVAMAVKWFRKAAAQGNAYAQDYLANKITRVTITWKSDPPGAVLYDDERRVDFTPFSLNYKYNQAKTYQYGITTSAMVRWSSGATAKVLVFIDPRKLLILPDCDPHKDRDCAARERVTSSIDKNHLLQSYTFKRPDNVPGRVADEEFALKVEASDREQFGQDTPSCRKEAATVEKERQAILREHGNVSDTEFNKFENDEIAYATRCLPPAKAALIEQRLHDIKVESQMKIDTINARQQPTITIQPSRPSMEELIMQQSTQPPASNSIHCSTNNVNGTVYTDCN